MSASPTRRPVHTRSIHIEAFARGDGLLDIEATLTDVKGEDFMLATGVRKQGDPVHAMRLLVTIDARLDIVDAQARSDWTPYPQNCADYGDAYRQLIGLNLGRNFRAQVRERLGGTRGCTHLTELAAVLPTAAIQAFASEFGSAAQVGGGAQQPFQLDRCHALRIDGPVVATFYPQWHRASETSTSKSTFQGRPE